MYYDDFVNAMFGDGAHQHVTEVCRKFADEFAPGYNITIGDIFVLLMEPTTAGCSSSDLRLHGHTRGSRHHMT